MNLPLSGTDYMLNTGCLLSTGGHLDRFYCSLLGMSSSNAEKENPWHKG